MSYQDIISVCQRCIIDCTHCINEMKAEQSYNDCPTCCIECIEVCELTIKALARKSPKSEEYLALCASVCEWCARQCRAHDHEHCHACAETCKKCATLCNTEAVHA